MRTRHGSDCDEHGIFSGRWEIDLTLKEHQKVEDGPEFEIVLFGIWGPRATDTLASMNNLALILGKYGQAEEMHRQTLRLQETVLGKENPNTLISMNNLASMLRDQ